MTSIFYFGHRYRPSILENKLWWLTGYAYYIAEWYPIGLPSCGRSIPWCTSNVYHTGLVHQYGIPRAAQNLRSGAIILINDFWNIFTKIHFRKELSLRSAESSINFFWIRSYTKIRPKTLFLSQFLILLHFRWFVTLSRSRETCRNRDALSRFRVH